MQEDLCKATAHWLAYRRAAGFGHVSEALLMFPLAECLVASGYDIKPEADTTKYGVGTPGLFNYDVVAEKNGSHAILLETKYLKARPNMSRCLIDMLKLALPPGGDYQRLLLVAGDAATVENFSLNPEYDLDDLVKVTSPGQAFGKFLVKFRSEASHPRRISVEASRTIVAGEVAAKTFSVGRGV